MSDDLIKRSDVLSMIDAFERDFEQSWRVQFRANIDAIPEVKDERIEQLERERDEAMMTGHDLAKIEYRDLVGGLEAKLAKAVEIGNEMAASIKGNYYIPNVVAEWNAVLAELEGNK